jgi:hypothetical protein
MPEDSKQMGARASNSPQLSLPSMRRVTSRLQDALFGVDENCESRTIPLSYVSEDDGDIEITLFGSDESSDDQR